MAVRSVTGVKRHFTSLLGYNSVRKRHADIRKLIGEREIVGHGPNSQPNYLDHPSFPFPAIRFREPTPELLVSSHSECVQNAILFIIC